MKAGTISDVGTTSFFPSKNLGCYGDGGAIYTNDEALAKGMRMVASHGESRRYYHDIIGVNSRLDAIQAAILSIKLKRLDEYAAARQKAADYYDAGLAELDGVTTPYRAPFSSHVFHQYTMKIADGKRDALREHLNQCQIPNNIYYPVPLYKQKAFAEFVPSDFGTLPNTEMLCEQVLSLPMHTELDHETQDYIIDCIKDFYK